MGNWVFAGRWHVPWHFLVLTLALSRELSAAAKGWKPLGPFGGRVNVVAVDPFRPQVVFAGTDNGGVFKSVDGGSSWRASSSGLEAGHIRALVFDPTEPGVMYAATAAGLFKSTDSGNSWFALGEGLGRRLLETLAVNPWQNTHLLAGTDEGLFWSNDAGVFWLRVPVWVRVWRIRNLTFAPSDPGVVYATTWSMVMKSVDGGWSWHSTALQGVPVFSLVVDPRSPDVVYAAGYQGVRKSTDGGQTWVLASDGLGLETVWCLAQSPSRLDTLYAGTRRGVYKTENAGKSWQRANLGMQGIWVTALAVDPRRADTVYAGTEAGVYRTNNGGKSWSPSVEELSASTVDVVAVDPVNSRTFYCFSRDNPYGKSALLKTTDRGRSWTLLRPLEWDQTPVALFVDPQENRTIYAAVQGLGLLKSEDGGSSWAVTTPPGLTYITAMALDPQNTQKLYLVQGSTLLASSDGGEVWEQLSQVPLEWYEGDSWLPVVRVLVVHPQTPQMLYVGASNGQIFKSTDGGLTWRPSQLPEERGSVTSVAISATNPQRLYVGTEWGLLVSNDGGESFAYLASLNHARITSVAFVDDPQGIIVGTAYSGVMASFDGGETWVSLNAGLSCRSVKKVVADPQRALSLFVATDGGGLFELTLTNPPRPVLPPAMGRGR